MQRILVLAFLLGACGSSPSTADDDDDGQTIDAAVPDAEGSPCGTCPDGTTCGTANGTPVCRTPEGIPAFSHVFVILMENTSYDTLVQSTNTPYIHGLMDSGAISPDYHGVEHPSLPNYIALVSGAITDNGPLSCDCQPTGSACDQLSCTILTNSCGCPQAQEQMVDQLEAAGVSWKAYAEDIGTPCNLTAAGDYAPKHVPFLYFPSLTDDTTRCNSHVVDYGGFAGDLAGTVPRYVFIAPNLVNDMHDPVPSTAQNLANGDAWLSEQVPPILASAAYQQGGILIIAWDEDDLSGIFAPDDPIPFIVLSPLANQAYESTGRIDHYNLLATIEDAFGVPRLGAAAAAAPLADFFPAN